MYFYAFYPLGLDVPLLRRPWLSIALIAVMTGAFLWLRYAPQLGPLPPAALVFWPGNGAPVTALTAIFLHGSWMHLLGNLVYLVVFAPALEDRLGRGRFLLLFLMLGVAGNLAHGVVAVEGWFGQRGLAVLGASGAISGLLGVAMVRLSYARVAIGYWVFAPLQGQNRAGKLRLPVPVAVASWLLLQLVHTAVARESAASVSYGAHLGGFTLGILLGFVLGLRRQERAEASLQRAHDYLDRGEAFAALGEYESYLALAPDDLTVRREQARAALMDGRTRQAATQLRALFEVHRKAGRMDTACDVYLEARRLQPGLGLSASELATLAHRLEKCGQPAAAVQVYQDLVGLWPRHPDADRAWVRIVTMLHGVLDQPGEARHWLQRACAALPDGAWRDYLHAEFRPEMPSREDPARAGAPMPRGPAA